MHPAAEADSDGPRTRCRQGWPILALEGSLRGSLALARAHGSRPGAWVGRCMLEAEYGPGVCFDPDPDAAGRVAAELGWEVGDLDEALGAAAHRADLLPERGTPAPGAPRTTEGTHHRGALLYNLAQNPENSSERTLQPLVVVAEQVELS